MERPPVPDVSSIRTIHLVAIAGVGMASLAGMLRARGLEVTGSDQNVYPPASTLLDRLGIRVCIGYRAGNLAPRPDLVVVGNAVSRTNPEVQALLASGIPYLSMAEALRLLFLAGKRPLVVAGTHGKTTSTSMLAWVLHETGRDPSVMVGGESLDLDANFRLGGGADFVIEGDEYDTAFFDKGPKFLHYDPQALILTSIEFDHADIYADVEGVTDAFVRLLGILPGDAPLVACADFPRVAEALGRAGRSAQTFGFARDAEWRPTDMRDETGRTRFRIRRGGRVEAEVSLRLMGEMNARNAVSVFALCRALGLAAEEIVPGLATFRGVRRRQEVLREDRVTVIDDFAHHPTAIAGTIEAVRRRWPDRRLWAIFEPRSNTSRRRVFQHEFAAALSGADASVVAGVFFKETDPLAEDERLSVGAIVEHLRKQGRDAWTFPTIEEVLDHLRSAVAAGDVVVFMSNGAFGGLPRRFAESFPRS